MNHVNKLPPSVSLNTRQGLYVEIIDQRKLPDSLEIMKLCTPQDFYGAIRSLAVRGAPAIGICAAYGMYVTAVAYRKINGISSSAQLYEYMKRTGEYLISSRPTAVNLSVGVNRMLKAAAESMELPADRLCGVLKKEAEAFHNEDIAMCSAISEYGLSLIKDGDGILTHCNAGPLATSRYGTGLGPIIMGCERGMKLRAYVDETRPLMQGARLTALELMNAGADVRLICDNMAAYVMNAGLVNAVFTGCDRVAANGDTANKIGTCGAAVIAKHYGIPMYVFCPSSTIDFSCESGRDIVIEERSPEEITSLYGGRRIAPEGVKCLNPAFDVTPAELITAIVTEKGICRPPYDVNLRRMFENGQG